MRDSKIEGKAVVRIPHTDVNAAFFGRGAGKERPPESMEGVPSGGARSDFSRARG